MNGNKIVLYYDNISHRYRSFCKKYSLWENRLGESRLYIKGTLNIAGDFYEIIEKYNLILEMDKAYAIYKELYNTNSNDKIVIWISEFGFVQVRKFEERNLNFIKFPLLVLFFQRTNNASEDAQAIAKMLFR